LLFIRSSFDPFFTSSLGLSSLCLGLLLDLLLGPFLSLFRVKKRSSDDCDIITIENAEFDNIEVEEGSTLSLFGIEIKSKVWVYVGWECESMGWECGLGVWECGLGVQ
ncbi:hypothetical protein RhiirA4_527083, partial [Rhizophagus irregularis]